MAFCSVSSAKWLLIGRVPPSAAQPARRRYAVRLRLRARRISRRSGEPRLAGGLRSVIRRPSPRVSTPREYLQRRGSVGPHFQSRLLPLADGCVVLDAVEPACADAGIVDQSDAAASRRCRTWPSSSQTARMRRWDPLSGGARQQVRLTRGPLRRSPSIHQGTGSVNDLPPLPVPTPKAVIVEIPGARGIRGLPLALMEILRITAADHRSGGPGHRHHAASRAPAGRGLSHAARVPGQGPARNLRVAAARDAAGGDRPDLVMLLAPRGISAARWRIGIEIVFTWKAVVIAMAVMGLPLLVRTARAGFEQVDAATSVSRRPWRPPLPGLPHRHPAARPAGRHRCRRPLFRPRHWRVRRDDDDRGQHPGIDRTLAVAIYRLPKPDVTPKRPGSCSCPQGSRSSR